MQIFRKDGTSGRFELLVGKLDEAQVRPPTAPAPAQRRERLATPRRARADAAAGEKRVRGCGGEEEAGSRPRISVGAVRRGEHGAWHLKWCGAHGGVEVVHEPRRRSWAPCA